MYQNVCALCKEQGVTTRYIGESARTMSERNGEHQADALNANKSSHNRDHILAEQPVQLEIMMSVFDMSIVQSEILPHSPRATCV